MFLTLLRTSIRTICTPVYRGSQSARQIPPIVRCTRTLHSAACGVWQVGVVAKCREADMENILYMCILRMNEESYLVRSHCHHHHRAESSRAELLCSESSTPPFCHHQVRVAASYSDVYVSRLEAVPYKKKSRRTTSFASCPMM